MSGRRRATLSPSLFPFLAVLVCTLGTLILFLALVAQKAEQTAQQAVEDPDAPPPVEELVEQQQWKRERLIAIRDAQTADLKERSSQLTHIEDHIRRLRDQLQQLREETAAAAEDSDLDPHAQQQQIVLLEQQIDAEKKRLEELREQVSGRPPRVVIVPHQGPNGTDQRPIYVECTADGLRLQPEGAFISKLQVESARGPAGGNPLDAALRTIRYHWQQTDPDGPAPYPLLIVRPDGIETYAAARAAMQRWDDQFGYELVPGEVELAFPEPNGQLRERVDVAIREAVARQHANLAAASYTRTRLSQLRKNAPRVLSAADLARSDGAAGAGPRYFGRPVDDSTPSRHGSIAGSDIHDFDEALRATARQSADGRTDPEQNAAGLSGPGFAAGGAGFGAGGAGFGAGGADFGADGADFASGDKAGRASPGERDMASSSHRPRTNPLALGSSTGSPTAADHQGGIGRGETGHGQMGRGEIGRGEMGLAPPANAPQTTDRADAAGGQSSDVPASDGPASGDPAGSIAAGRPGQGRLDAAGQIDGNSQGPSDAQQGANLAGAQGGSGHNAMGQMATAAPQQAAPRPALPQSTDGASPGSGQAAGRQPTLRRGGRDWALPASARGRGTTIVRGVNVVCEPTAFVLLADQAGGQPQRFEFHDGFVDRAAMELATAVHSRVDSWGVAIAGGRWQPVLRVQADRTSESRYRQLRTLLQGSGLELERR
ncbi:hypothetical protein [Roseimaritima sediminicola]|uniref:hypothetical protein n=1 Tax=Roseimaritima sediminicola TaxID=2662066 RepID=UPI00129829CB|nr:hypothetical protein [Roseimaritima sediminicola]